MSHERIRWMLQIGPIGIVDRLVPFRRIYRKADYLGSETEVWIACLILAIRVKNINGFPEAVELQESE